MHHSQLSRPGYMPGEYPKVKYAPSGGSVVVENSTEERALGPGWSDNPPAAIADEPAADEPAEKPKKKRTKKAEADDSAASE